MTRKTRSRPRASWRKHVLIACALVLLAAGFYAGFRAAQPPPPDFESLRAERDAGAEATEPPDSDAGRPSSEEGAPDEPPPTDDAGVSSLELRRQPPPGAAGGKPRIALVIDDLGRSVQDLETLRALDIPITYSVLPFEVRTSEVVELLRQRGEEVLCHLPMEAKGGNNPGPGALHTSMDPEEMRRATEAALDAVPGAVGLNNHMGSAVMSDVGSMEIVLEVLESRGLYFLDSRTTADTVGYSLARRRGIPTAERQVFLDTHKDRDFIRKQFTALLEAARERGGAIAIAHPYEETLEILASAVPEARAQGFEFVTAGRLVDR